MSTLTRSSGTEKLAAHGGSPAIVHPLPPMFPGGMRIGAEEEEAVLEVLRTKRLFRYYGPNPGTSKVQELETAFGRAMGTDYALAVASGTIALASGLAALGIGPGDEVIVPAYTWISTPAAVLALGALPVLAEVDGGLTLDAEDAESRIGPRTKALLPVHMRGAPADMGPLIELARSRHLSVLEDAAQANGVSYGGRRVGSIGDIGAFSLQFNKILTCGEGGIVTTNDRRLYERAAMYHDVAATGRADIAADEAFLGVNARLSELQGATALVQLGRLDGLLADMRAARAAIYERVADLAADRGVAWRHQPDPAGDAGLAMIFYLPSASQAQEVVQALRAEGMAKTQVLFAPESRDNHVAYHWGPLLARRSWSPAGQWDGHDGARICDPASCPRTLDLLARAVHLDVSPDLTEENVAEIGLALEKVLRSLPPAPARGLQ